MTKDVGLYDKRVLIRNLNKGALSEKEITKHLNSLPDMASQAETVVLDNEEETATND